MTSTGAKIKKNRETVDQTWVFGPTCGNNEAISRKLFRKIRLTYVSACFNSNPTRKYFITFSEAFTKHFRSKKKKTKTLC